jgi:hypothetical protein
MNPNYWPRPLRLGPFLLAIDLNQSWHPVICSFIWLLCSGRNAVNRYAPLGRKGEPLREFTRRFDKPDAVRFEDCACNAPSMGDKARLSSLFAGGFAV